MEKSVMALQTSEFYRWSKYHFSPGKLALIVIVFCSTLFDACRPREELPSPGSVELQFSIDTVLFDTVFTNVGNVTKRVVIKNPSDRSVTLDAIFLGAGAQSSYTFVADGIQGPVIQNLEILGRDSILVLITVFIDPQNQDLPFIVNDSLIIENKGLRQQIQLVSWGQDALFLNASTIGCDTTWANNRPVVIFNSALVPFGCRLTILPGTKIYMHNNSNLFVGGELQINGSAEEKVLFRGTRLEIRFENTPGQWGGIIFLDSASPNSVVDHAIIRNATNGIRYGRPDDGDNIPELRISNTLIRNASNNGLLFFSVDVDVSNTIIANCGQTVVSAVAGGSYRFFHCSLADYSTLFQREESAFVFSNNLLLGTEPPLISALNLTLINCILDGNLEEELILSNDPSAGFVLDVRHCILRTQNQSFNINNNQLNINPRFKNISEVDFQLDTLSPAKDSGILIQGFPGVDSDFLGVSRPQGDTVDIGAFERVE